MYFNEFLETLPIMAQGMAGVFIVILIIAASIIVMNRIFREGDNKK